MYEQVNDPFTRDRLVESLGFCNWHAGMIPSVHYSPGSGADLHESPRRTPGAPGSGPAGGPPRKLWRRLRESLTGWREEPLPKLAWRSEKIRRLTGGDSPRAAGLER